MNKLYIYTTLCISVKQDLAYDSSTGMLVGFTDIGNRDNPRADELATHALTIYVKSFCGKPGLKYPIAYFEYFTDWITACLDIMGKYSSIGKARFAGKQQFQYRIFCALQRFRNQL